MSSIADAIQDKCLAFGDRVIKLNDYLLKQAANAQVTRTCPLSPPCHPLPDTSWKFVPQIIKDEITVNGKQNLIIITEEQIQAEVDALVGSR